MTVERWTHFSGTTRQLAKRLLGKTLARRTRDGPILKGTIVEVEAYLADCDSASHCFGGKKNKNASMFSSAGTLYVYPIHAKHCVNVVTEGEGQGAAVLIRAVEPFEGLDWMRKSRGLETLARTRKSHQDIILTQGPGRLCQAFDIDRGLDGVDLGTCRLVWIEPPSPEVERRKWKTRISPRIGITKAKSLPLRYFVDGNLFVSGRSGDHSKGRSWTFHSEP